MKQLKIRRILSGMTQFTLAQRTGIAPSRISLLERGLLEPTQQERDALAGVLAVSGDSLFRPVSVGPESLGQLSLPCRGVRDGPARVAACEGSER